MPLRDRVGNILAGLGRNADITGDLEKIVSKLEPSVPLDPLRKRNWFELIKQINKAGDQGSKDADTFVAELTKDLMDAKVSETRIKKYRNLRSLKKSLPIVKKILDILTDNIMAPDDITKKCLRVMKDNDTFAPEDRTMISILTDIVKYMELDEKMDEYIPNTLELGDYFIEVSTMDNELQRALDKSNIALKEEEEFYAGVKEEIKREVKQQMDCVHFIDTVSILEYTSGLKEGTASLSIDESTNADMLLEDDDEAAPFDVDFQDDSSKIKLSDIVLIEHEPSKVIVLHKNKRIMGYLILESDNQYSTQHVNAVGSTGDRNTSNPSQYPEEDSVINAFVDQLFIKTLSFLKNKSISHIDPSIKDALTTVLKARGTTHSDINIRYVPPDNIEHFKLNSDETYPYGESVLSTLEFILKLYLARMISSTIYRIARSGKHIVYYVNMDGRDARNKIESVKRSVRKREITTDTFNTVDTIPSVVSTFEDFFIPVVNGKKTVEIDNLDFGSYSEGREADDNSLLKAILTGVNIPPSYLGVEENVEAKATLTQESELFARSIIRYQKVFSKHTTNLIRKIYSMVYGKDHGESYMDFRITFYEPRGLMVDMYRTVYDQIKGIFDNLTAMGVKEDYIKKKYLPEIDWEGEEIDKIISPDQEGGETPGDLLSGLGSPGPGAAGELGLGGLGMETPPMAPGAAPAPAIPGTPEAPIPEAPKEG